MTEGWGMVAAAAIALMGVFSGLFIGRRQVRDQAQVEHGQWLRGQRQEAFVALIAAWDEAIPKIEARLLDDEGIDWVNQTDRWDEGFTSVVEGTEKDRQPLRRAAERVQILGPEPVDRVVAAMLGTVEKLSRGLEAQYTAGPGDQQLALYREAQGEIEVRREVFLIVARNVLRQTPDTKRP